MGEREVGGRSKRRIVGRIAISGKGSLRKTKKKKHFIAAKVNLILSRTPI